MVRIELYDLLGKTQEYIAKYYATALTDEQKHDQLKSYIEKYILDGGFIVHGFTEDKLIDRLYAEMVEYSILTPFLGAADLDEININAWDDITLTYSDGRMVKLEEHFRSPSHAIDIDDIILNVLGGSCVIILYIIIEHYSPNNIKKLKCFCQVEKSMKTNQVEI